MMDFKQAWQHMEKQGYRYGDSALENVRMGWEMAHGQHGVPISTANNDARDAARWRRLVNASELAFPVLAICWDPENDKTMLYGRQRLEDLVDGMDEISPTYPVTEPSPIKKEDIKVNVFLRSEPGWALPRTYVGVTHTPSGLAITCASERGQHANRAKVMKALEAAVSAVSTPLKKEPEKVTSVADLSLKEMHERCPGFGGCEAEPPKGWYCTKEFHHNGPCHHLAIHPAKEACCVKGIMEPSGICEDCKTESQGYSATMGVTDDEKRKRAIEAWTKVAQKAGISLIGGKKFLCLDEDMCLELGLAFEALGWVHHEEG